MLGNDQSPGAGQCVIATTARHGRSWSTATFNASLIAYAATTPAPITIVAATPWASRRRSAPQPTSARIRPSSTRGTSEAASSHAGTPPIASCAHR
ncbi:hypothetical protein [Streptosporangium sp. NPDC023615]|uniref:hypothetical protein n=1 Tax=Streptosporangium sp. NPDC023615 TaxID=3154794 RepID=UPI003430FBFA